MILLQSLGSNTPYYGAHRGGHLYARFYLGTVYRHCGAGIAPSGAFEYRLGGAVAIMDGRVGADPCGHLQLSPYTDGRPRGPPLQSVIPPSQIKSERQCNHAKTEAQIGVPINRRPRALRNPHKHPRRTWLGARHQTRHNNKRCIRKDDSGKRNRALLHTLPERI